MKFIKSPKVREYLKLLTIPLVLMGIYLTMVLVWEIFSLPSTDELIVIVTDYFSRYGLWIVFFSALIEGVLLLGQYFPGGFIIFLGVISAAGNVMRAAQVVLVVSLSFFIAYYVNYIIGRYGWYKLFTKFGLKKALDSGQKRLTKHGLKAIFFTYWEPNLASIIATAAGVLHLSVKKFLFYSIAGILVWNAFWGILVFKLGEVALELTGSKYIGIVFLIWIAIILVVNYIKKRREKKK